MEAQTDIQTYLEQGKQALAQGRAREAAIAYAHGAQLEAENPAVHLGLAEANLALGNYGVVHMACRRVQELQPMSGIESQIAQALLDLLDRRYERALQTIDAVISEDPGIAYAHALRAHLLRATGQDYDASRAISRAGRLSYGGRFNNCFPALEKRATPIEQEFATAQNNGAESQRIEREPVPSWSPPSNVQRQIIRTRFTLSQYPSLFTYALIAINVIVYILTRFSENLLVLLIQYNPLILQGQYWRLFTSMFLHDPNNILHIALNMLSLFFVGRFVEFLFGKWRYLLIYFLAGLGGNILYLVLSPAGPPSLGASGAIFGVFGALGIYYLLDRSSIRQGMLSNWLLWLTLNLVLGFAGGDNINMLAHIGGLVVGMLAAFLLFPRQRRRRYI